MNNFNQLKKTRKGLIISVVVMIIAAFALWISTPYIFLYLAQDYIGISEVKEFDDADKIYFRDFTGLNIDETTDFYFLEINGGFQDGRFKLLLQTKHKLNVPENYKVTYENTQQQADSEEIVEYTFPLKVERSDNNPLDFIVNGDRKPITKMYADATLRLGFSECKVTGNMWIYEINGDLTTRISEMDNREHKLDNLSLMDSIKITKIVTWIFVIVIVALLIGIQIFGRKVKSAQTTLTEKEKNEE